MIHLAPSVGQVNYLSEQNKLGFNQALGAHYGQTTITVDEVTQLRNELNCCCCIVVLRPR